MNPFLSRAGALWKIGRDFIIIYKLVNGRSSRLLVRMFREHVTPRLNRGEAHAFLGLVFVLMIDLILLR